MTNWNLCFICQRITNKFLQLINDGLIALATTIPKFNEHGRLKFDYSQIAKQKCKIVENSKSFSEGK